MKNILLVIVAGVTTLGLVSAEFERDLQSVPPTVPKGRKRPAGPLDSYPDDVQVDFNANLKCGSCIRGNYIYCVNGKEGDADLSTKA